MPEHSAAPWTVSTLHGTIIESADKLLVAAIFEQIRFGHEYPVTTAANTVLILHAPTLLAACISARDELAIQVRGFPYRCEDTYHDLVQAIGLATGKIVRCDQHGGARCYVEADGSHVEAGECLCLGAPNKNCPVVAHREAAR